MKLLGLDEDKVWSTEEAYNHLKAILSIDSKRSAERKINELISFPEDLDPQKLQTLSGGKITASILEEEIEQSKKHKNLVLFIQTFPLSDEKDCLYAHDARGTRYWVPFAKNGPEVSAVKKLQAYLQKSLFVVAPIELQKCLTQNKQIDHVSFPTYAYPKEYENDFSQNHHPKKYPHLKALEDESIFIIREAVAESENPAMLYSVGKDSSVMLHLARKAFYPGPLPFPLVHVDTRYKFQEMYAFRSYIAKKFQVKLITHINPDAIEKNINPFDHGSSLHTDITKTQGLKQVLNEHGFDLVFGGARRDEEKSRAKERIFSFRNADHSWDPKNQRPELWNLYNTKINKGESIRVFPISNWTELDVWQYIKQENISVVPLYFSKVRPVINRSGMLMMVDDHRLKVHPEEKIEFKNIRFRTLGCYPLTGAIESPAYTLDDIIAELQTTRYSERQGRLIDFDGSGSMEKKKKEGYF